MLNNQTKATFNNYQERASIYSMSNINIQNGFAGYSNNSNNANILYQKHQHQPKLKKASVPTMETNHVFFNQQDQQHHMLFDEFLHNSLVFNGINRPTPMLDNGPAKFKSSLIKRGSLASRQLPLQQQQQQQNGTLNNNASRASLHF